jgi:hypothetical protein
MAGEGQDNMATWKRGRVRALVATLGVVGIIAAAAAPGQAAAPSFAQQLKRSAGLARLSEREIASNAAAKTSDSGGKEGANEIQEGAAQWAEPRYGPPGALLRARAHVAGMATMGGSWSEVTSKPYNSDDLHYADPAISNSGGGSGFVSGRMTALAVDGSYTYAGAADGGVWRSTDGGATWTPLTDRLASTSIGSLAVNHADHSVWLGTGEANTSSDSFMGVGVYRSTNHGTTWTRVGGHEIDGQMIGKLAFDGRGRVYAATSSGVYRHRADGSFDAGWTLVLRPGTPGPYGFTFANDVVVRPGTQGMTVIANVAWRGGYTDYNGFYRSTDGGNHWTMVDPAGIDAANIGRAAFAYRPDGKRLYTVVESIKKYNSNPETAMMGVYVSPSGDLAGPWKLAASAKELGNAPGDALGFGSGYSPGIQIWYDLFIGVDPVHPSHVYLGLEEVFESTNAGGKWTAIGPYWNFTLPCYAQGGPTNCPPTTHPDQHAIAFDGHQVWVGNDGGVYSRSLTGGGWRNHDRDLRALQYYYGGTGMLDGGIAYWGGLQDNGGSFLLPGAKTMVSPFGGDGGDTIVDPGNANRTVQEYVGNDMWLTTNGGRSDGTTSAFREITPACGAFTYTPNPCDPDPRFIAPFRADVSAPNKHWVTGGEFVWETSKGWNTHCSATACDWKQVHDTGVASQITALAVNGTTIYAGYCGYGCNPTDVFYSGIDTNFGGTWHTVAGPGMTNGGDQLPQRVPSNLVVDPHHAGHVFAIYSGYSRRWIPGGGVGHVFESSNGGATWSDISGNLPDAPADDLVMSNGRLVLGTDVGMFISSAASPGTWRRFGHGLPNAVVNDLTTTPNGGMIVAVTHGRGMWRIAAP